MAVLHALDAWTNFYVIVGSSAGALTGLQFVVVALVADLHDTRGFARTSAAFATPTVVHFSCVLVLAAIVAAPWHAIGGPMILIGCGGGAGLVYTMIVARRARTQVDYRPVFEDWLFHVLLPAVAYLTMAIAAAMSRGRIEATMFAIAGSAVLLLVVGIHNAWDAVTYIVATRSIGAPKHNETHERSRHR